MGRHDRALFLSSRGRSLSCRGVPGSGRRGPLTVYVGTYTDGTSKGIYRFSLDLETRQGHGAGARRRGKNPSFLALHPNGRFLYAVSEIDELRRCQDGVGDRLRDRPEDGRPHAARRGRLRGAGPCHLIVDKGGKNVLVANYGGGTVAVLPIGPDGKLQKASCGSPPRGQGQGRAAPGQAARSRHLPRRRRALRARAGPRRRPRLRLRVRRRRRARSSRTAPGVLEPGSGPRHLSVPPVGPLRLRDQRAQLDGLGLRLRRREGRADAAPDRLKALPAGLSGTSYTAEIEVSPGRPLPLRLEPRPRQPGPLRDRRRERTADGRRAHADRRQLAAPLQDRRVGPRADRRAPARRHGRLLPARPEDGRAEPARDHGRDRPARVRAAGARAPLASRCPARSTRVPSGPARCDPDRRVRRHRA